MNFFILIILWCCTYYYKLSRKKKRGNIKKIMKTQYNHYKNLEMNEKTLETIYK